MMSNSVQRVLRVDSCHDDELDAINLCCDAILSIAPAEARSRIIQYLYDRFK